MINQMFSNDKMDIKKPAVNTDISLGKNKRAVI